jgi:hypothetical protein
VAQELRRGAPLPGVLDIANLVNRAHPFAPSLWWLTLPQRSGGSAAWIDLCRNQRLIQTNTAVPATATSGYGRGTTRVGGFGDIRCDGVNDYWTMPKTDALNLSQGSLVISTYRTSLGGGQSTLVSLGDGTANGSNTWSLGWLDNTDAVNTVLIGSAAFVINAKTASLFPLNTWHQFVVTCNAQGNALYGNGNPLSLTYTSGSAATSSWWSTIYAGITTFDVGRGNTVNFPLYTPCRVDDLRIYPRALRPAEVRALYAHTKLGYPGLLRQLPLSTGTPGVATVPARPRGHIL